MDELLLRIRDCEICKAYLPFGPRPVVSAHPKSRLAVIGQAPGARVHKSGVPWDDPSGKQLRSWLGVSEEVFYNPQLIALVPMGFCYPGKGQSGDLPPRPECAPTWHQHLLDAMPQLSLIVTIGTYSQRYYLKEKCKSNLTETVRKYMDYAPEFFPIPHPSPRNRFWLSRNPWFEKQVLPALKRRVSVAIGK